MIFNSYKSKSELDIALSDKIIFVLTEILRTKKEAVVLFSGGSTPTGMLKCLATKNFDWSSLIISLVDDRMVDASNNFSNFKMIKELFFEQIAPEFRPKFLPLVIDPTDFKDNMDRVSKSFEQISQADLVLLGMGNDGHFASLFPNDPTSILALDAGNDGKLVYTKAAVHPEHRISFSWSFLKKSKHIFLQITGEEKLKIIQTKKTYENLPINALLSERDDAEIYWAI